jgi:hypothetical protein
MPSYAPSLPHDHRAPVCGRPPSSIILTRRRQFLCAPGQPLGPRGTQNPLEFAEGVNRVRNNHVLVVGEALPMNSSLAKNSAQVGHPATAIKEL